MIYGEQGVVAELCRCHEFVSVNGLWIALEGEEIIILQQEEMLEKMLSYVLFFS